MSRIGVVRRQQQQRQPQHHQCVRVLVLEHTSKSNHRHRHHHPKRHSIRSIWNRTWITTTTITPPPPCYLEWLGYSSSSVTMNRIQHHHTALVVMNQSITPPPIFTTTIHCIRWSMAIIGRLVSIHSHRLVIHSQIACDHKIWTVSLNPCCQQPHHVVAMWNQKPQPSL